MDCNTVLSKTSLFTFMAVLFTVGLASFFIHDVYAFDAEDTTVTRVSSTTIVIDSTDISCTLDSGGIPADWVLTGTGAAVPDSVTLIDAANCEVRLTFIDVGDFDSTPLVTYNTDGGSDLSFNNGGGGEIVPDDTPMAATIAVGDDSTTFQIYDIGPPSFTRTFTTDEHPVVIGNKTFAVSQFGKKLETTTLIVGEPVTVKVLLYDDLGPFNIIHVALHTNLRGSLIQVHNSDASIIYNKGKPVEVIDPSNFFANADVTVSQKGNKLEAIFNLTFAKEMEKSNIIFRAWDAYRFSIDANLIDVWEVVKPPPDDDILDSEFTKEEESDIQVIEPRVMSLNTDKTIYIENEKITFSGTSQGIDFGKIVTIIIRDTSGNFITLGTTIPDPNGNFQDQIEITEKFKSFGTYNAIAFVTIEHNGISSSFDFSKYQDAVPGAVPEPVKNQVPGWIKNNAKWWSEGQIREDDFLNGIQYMIQEKIINIPDLPEQTSSTANRKIPDWIRNNAAWWADDLISEDEFVNGIKYLVEKAIIQV